MIFSEVEHKQIINELFFSGELFQVLKMMVGANLKDTQLQQIVDKVRRPVPNEDSSSFSQSVSL